MVSVIIPCYNASKYIGQAIESVLRQGVETEIIVVDDCSMDETKEIVSKYLSMKNVHLICNAKNKGVAFSRNRGIKRATGQYVAFLDADDYWREDKLAKQISLLEEKKAFFCYTGRRIITENGEETNKIIGVSEEITYDMLCHHNEISCSSVLMKRTIAKNLRMKHDEVHEDYLMWLRFLKKYKVAFGINEPLLYYRLSENGKSRNKIESAKMTYGVHRYMGNTRWKSFYYMSLHLLKGIKKYKLK
ncbi:MAG: teichuronic acid biosynthesis glycosyltransferase TuaG [Clostridiales bacterium]|nr:teichuronic acid biosynthesis glycosyltransferase TuaG [Clostridiales bacterium]